MSLRFLKAKPKLGLSKNNKIRSAHNSNVKNDGSESIINPVGPPQEKQSELNTEHLENENKTISQNVPSEYASNSLNRKDIETDNENIASQATKFLQSCQSIGEKIENVTSEVTRVHSIEEDINNSGGQDQSAIINIVQNQQECETNKIPDNVISKEEKPNNILPDNTDQSKDTTNVVKPAEKNSDIKSTDLNSKSKINKFRFLKVKPKIQLNLQTKNRTGQPNKNTLNHEVEQIKNKTEEIVCISNNDSETEKKKKSILTSDDNSIVGSDESQRNYTNMTSKSPTLSDKNTTENRCSIDKTEDLLGVNKSGQISSNLCTSIIPENSDKSLRINKDLHSQNSCEKLCPVPEKNKPPKKVKVEDKFHREDTLQSDNVPTKSLSAYIKQLENKKFLSHSEKSNLLENENSFKNSILISPKKGSVLENSKKHQSKANETTFPDLKNNCKRQENTDIKCARSNKEIIKQKVIVPNNKNDQKKTKFEDNISPSYHTRTKDILTKENIDSVPIFIDKSNEITAIDQEETYEHLFDHMYAKKVHIPNVKRKNYSSDSTTGTKRKRKKRCYAIEKNKSLEVDNAFTRALNLQNQKDNKETESEEESEYESEASVDINIRTFEGMEHQNTEDGHLLNEISIMFKERNCSDFSGLSLVTKIIKEENYDPAEHSDEFRSIQSTSYDTVKLESSNHLEQHEESMILTDNIIDLDEKPVSDVGRKRKNVTFNIQPGADHQPSDQPQEEIVKKRRKQSICRTEDEVQLSDGYVSSDSEIIEVDEQDYLLYRKKPATKKKNSENMFSKRQSETLKKIKMESSWKENLTVHDLMFYNPSSEPMSTPPDTWKPKEEAFEDLKDEDEEAVDNPAAAPGPKLIIVNGKLVVDTNSLVIEETGLNKSKKKLAQSEAIIESAYSVKQYGDIYRRKKHLVPKGNVEWSPEDTLMFYRALSVIGTDFTMMNTMFVNRTRAAIKRKFKQEEKKNPTLLLKALTNYSNAFDMEELKRELDEDKKRAEKVKAMEKKKPKREQKEKIKEKRLTTSYGKIIKKCLLGEGSRVISDI